MSDLGEKNTTKIKKIAVVDSNESGESGNFFTSTNRGVFFSRQQTNERLSFPSTRKKILQLLGTEKQNLEGFLENCKNRYDNEQLRSFYLAEGEAIICLALINKKFLVENLSLIIDEMDIYGVTKGVLEKDNFARLNSILGGQKTMMQRKILPQDKRDDLINKIKMLLSKAPMIMNFFLKEQCQEYLTKQEKQKHFPFMLSTTVAPVLHMTLL